MTVFFCLCLLITNSKKPSIVFCRQCLDMKLKTSAIWNKSRPFGQHKWYFPGSPAQCELFDGVIHH